MRTIEVAQRGKSKPDKDGTLHPLPGIETYIKNPVMKGAVLDYKATALQLADQLLDAQDLLADERNIRTRNCRTIDAMHNEQTRARDQLKRMSAHWTALFWPKSWWNAVRACGVNV